MTDRLSKLRIVVASAVGFSSLIMSLTAFGVMLLMSDSIRDNILLKLGWLLPVLSIPLFLLFFFSRKAYAGSMILLAALNYIFLTWNNWTTLCANGNCGHAAFIVMTRPMATEQVILPLLNTAVVLFLNRREAAGS